MAGIDTVSDAPGSIACILQRHRRILLSLLTRLAQRLGLDMGRFIDDVQSHHLLPRVKADFMSAVRSGAAGTPSFFIDGEPYEGSLDDEALIEALRFAARARAAQAPRRHDAPRPRSH
jgi:predicted DsbA family dithiol-disulfide isomerase